jgi:hypothetical protein
MYNMFINLANNLMMKNIKVLTLEANRFEVTVNHSTVHIVTVEPEYALQLTDGKVTTEVLVEKSFEFLLKRESNTSILRGFNLKVISTYFPEYEQSISQYF